MILFDFGGLVKGDSQYADHKEWIQLQSARLNVDREIEQTGGASDRKPGTPDFDDITLTKFADVASVDLFIQAVGGKKPQKKVKIHFCNVTSKGPKVIMSWEMENAFLSSYEVSSDGARPFETLTLNFSKIKLGYTGFKPDGKSKKISPKGWNLETGGQI